MKLLTEILREAEQPLLLYHGGPKKITKLDASKVKGGSWASIGWGVYFTTSKYKAGDYGVESEFTVIDGSKLHILDMRKPVTQEFVNAAREYANSLPTDGLNILRSSIVNRMVDIFNDNVGVMFDRVRKNMLDSFNHNQEMVFLDMLKALGYDTVQDGYEYAIFDMDAGTNAIIQ